MDQEEARYGSIGQQMKDAVPGQLFGKPCFKAANGKAFICYFKQAMVFKLGGPDHAEALALDGALLFDPSGKGRPMKEWVQVPYAHSGVWPALAHSALEYVTRP